MMKPGIRIPSALSKQLLALAFGAMFGLLSLPTLAHAREGGSSAGDGGKGVICAGHAPELLDLYEVRQTSYARMIMGGSFSGQTLAGAFSAILSSAEINYPKLYTRIQSLVDQARLMDISAQRVEGPLQSTYDGPLPIQEDGEPCRVVQLAVTSRSEYRMTFIDANSWSQMDSLDQAFLLIHEVLQSRDAIARDAASIDSTKPLRNFVAHLALLLPTAEEKRAFEAMW